MVLFSNLIYIVIICPQITFPKSANSRLGVISGVTIFALIISEYSGPFLVSPVTLMHLSITGDFDSSGYFDASHIFCFFAVNVIVNLWLYS
jgi:hypothetical protein